MSAIKTYILGGAMIAVLSQVPGLFIPQDLPQAPIEVHELSMDAASWTVTQERTIHVPERMAGGNVPMEWAARLETADGGQTIHECAGGGAWAYTPGYLRAPMSAPVWTGNDACGRDVVPVGVPLVLVASWWTQDGQTVPVTARSEPFVIDGVSE